MIVRGLTALMVGLLFALPAWAVPGNGQGGGQGNLVTEEEDSDNVPDNIADEGDNLHPSGKDRSVEKGPGSQGKSQSAPDEDTRGPDRLDRGTDKPDSNPGGLDIFDQDYNNGCGNDDDFEDDNEGWCGGPGRPAIEEDGNGGNGGNGNGEVLGGGIKRNGELLGAALGDPAQLAVTGGPFLLLMGAAGALIVSGATLRSITRPRRHHRTSKNR